MEIKKYVNKDTWEFWICIMFALMFAWGQCFTAVDRLDEIYYSIIGMLWVILGVVVLSIKS